MPFSFRHFGVFLSAVALILFCSCEKHPVGEYPPTQKEHVELAGSSAEDSDLVKERPDSSEEGAKKPTPADFFPSATPH
jgi:hypothetical protein